MDESSHREAVLTCKKTGLTLMELLGQLTVEDIKSTRVPCRATAGPPRPMQRVKCSPRVNLGPRRVLLPSPPPGLHSKEATVHIWHFTSILPALSCHPKLPG